MKQLYKGKEEGIKKKGTFKEHRKWEKEHHIRGD